MLVALITSTFTSMYQYSMFRTLWCLVQLKKPELSQRKKHHVFIKNLLSMINSEWNPPVCSTLLVFSGRYSVFSHLYNLCFPLYAVCIVLIFKNNFNIKLLQFPPPSFPASTKHQTPPLPSVLQSEGPRVSFPPLPVCYQCIVGCKICQCEFQWQYYCFTAINAVKISQRMIHSVQYPVQHPEMQV